ncbi:hypothetical protein QUA41_30755 [Microcoleus sp. Pol11C1]|uniref:hypothetical protein n=1 Tax=unclassified Microcoleus TaxID=2642155 RepID=UPI002FD55A9A
MINGEVREGLQNSFTLITTLGPDLSDSEREELIEKSYISSRSIIDFLNGELDVETFLDVQEFCLTQPMDNYLQIVHTNIESLSFAELLLS